MKKRWKLVTGAAVILAGFVAIAGVSWLFQPSLTQLTATGGMKLRPQWSPDGANLVYLQVFARDATDGDILAKLLATDSEGRSPRELSAQYLMTGDHYSWDAGSELLLIRTLTQNGDYIATLMPDGEGLFGAVYPEEGQKSAGVWAPDWSDSSGLVFFLRLAGEGRGELVALNPQDEQIAPRVLARFEAPPYERLNVTEYGVAVSHDGQFVVYKTRERIFMVPAAGGTPRQLAGDAAFETEPVWAPDDKSVAYVNQQGRLIVAPVDGSSPRDLAPALTAEGIPDWSPANGLIAVAARREASGARVYSVRPTDGKVRELVDMAGCSWPKWSPDGKGLAYLQTEESGTDLWLFSWR